jgi:hypothetical protein
MKTNIIDRILILLAFNSYKIATFLFAISLILCVFIYIFLDKIPLVICYLFWFSLGFFGFSLIVKMATGFLEKKLEEKSNFYLDLLSKNKKYTSSWLRVIYRK